MTFETDQLAELMTSKCECLGQLAELGRRQLALIGKGDLAELLKVLAIKQRLLTALQSIERQLDPFRDQSPELRSWRSDELHAACQRLVVRCNSLLGEVMEQERQSESRLIENRDQAAIRLEGMHVAAQARGAYGETDSSFGQLDLSSGI